MNEQSEKTSALSTISILSRGIWRSPWDTLQCTFPGTEEVAPWTKQMQPSAVLSQLTCLKLVRLRLG